MLWEPRSGSILSEVWEEGVEQCAEWAAGGGEGRALRNSWCWNRVLRDIRISLVRGRYSKKRGTLQVKVWNNVDARCVLRRVLLRGGQGYPTMGPKQSAHKLLSPEPHLFVAYLFLLWILHIRPNVAFSTILAMSLISRRKIGTNFLDTKY